MKFSEPYDRNCRKDYDNRQKGITEEIIDKVFPSNSEELYTQLLKRSIFTTKIYEFIATLKFDLFGYVSPNTPVYNIADKPWLFYERETTDESGGFYHTYSQEEIKTYCNNIAYLKKELEEKYNLEMLFLPIPTKFTIYHNLVTDDEYNNFLPMLFAELNKRNIPYVDVYHDYVSSDKILYYGTDTHWNKKGVDIALQNTVIEIDTICNVMKTNMLAEKKNKESTNNYPKNQ
jgi:hypothetical protein